MIKTKDLTGGYKNVVAVRDVDLTVAPKTVTGIVGLNGAGKSTLLKLIAGAMTPMSGGIYLGGEEITHLPAEKRVRRGVALVPEGRHVFASLTVQENLKVAFLKTDSSFNEKLYCVYSLFPDLERLKKKKAATLSGGQQQMLAIGRALMSGAKTLLFDEPTMGLSPAMCNEVFALIERLTPTLEGTLITGQEVERIARLSNTLYGMKNARLFPTTPITAKRDIM